MPKVSIIMPSLNVGSYIRECIESVLAQTLSDIEVLCVDAGSTDGTLEILEKYAKKDSRVRVIHSDRKSYGYQMNLGIQEANSEYIGIVETDDFIAPDMMKELYEYAAEHDADFVKSDFDVFSTLDDGQRIFLRYSLGKYSGVKYNTCISSKEYVRSRQTIDVFIWNGIYKKEFLLANNIRFQETPGAAFQDCGFRYQVALHVRRGFFLDKSFYRYRRDNIGSSTYNKKCVLFNLAEAKNLVRLLQESDITDRASASYLAREIAIIADAPYVELLMWNEPAEETYQALKEFSDILNGFIKSGVLNPLTATSDLWFRIKLLTENVDLYDAYAHMKAKASVEVIKTFLQSLSGKKQIVLFGSGQIGTAAYCMLRLNGMRNIVAFCDNNEDKWNSLYMGCPIQPLQSVREQYPDAHYVITISAPYADDIRKQLEECGVKEEQISTYSLSTYPLDCTNKVMSSCLY